MAWTVDYDEASGFIVVAQRGRTTGADLREATSAAIALGTRCGIQRFLVDTTEMVAAVPAIAVYHLAHTQYPAAHLDRSSCLALVLPATAKERDLARFYETVCLNRGWRVQLFENGEDARRWLVEARDSPPGVEPDPS
jgi:hypothetical protein